jgi:3-(3-hydroxy-phenyl)propionate hydroxylase
VSPFGARGANTGVQDIDNLIWKLKLVLDGKAPLALVDSYHEERAFAADDNLLNSTRSTDFITPKTSTARLLRDAVLELAHHEPSARPLVNSGRLSRPTPYVHSSLNTPDDSDFAGLMSPGTNFTDAPVQDARGREGWLLNHLGQDFVVLSFGPAPMSEVRLDNGVGARVLSVGTDLRDTQGLLTQRCDARPGTVYLLRPDQHVAARWRRFDAARIRGAMAKCLAA